MSKRFQKTFITAQEFVENWDKEIYKLDYLDYFVYLLINHLGNQLENRFMSRRTATSAVALTFDDIATLAFNLGDSFEYFLQERPQTGGRASRTDHGEDELSANRSAKDKGRRQAIATEEILREKNFRGDLMDNVILDTLIQFYCDELNIEFEEEEREIGELADFIHDVICEFISKDGKAFLTRPEEPAVEYFVELLDAEKDYREPEEIDWNAPDDGWDGEIAGDWDMPNEDVETVLQIFVDQLSQKDDRMTDGITRSISLFEEYLREEAALSNIFELGEEHFQEFFSVWLIQKLSDEENMALPPVFHALARLTGFLQQDYDIDLKRLYLRNYQNLKNDVPRVIKALRQYFADCDLLDILLNRENREFEQMSGFFEVRDIKNRHTRTLGLSENRLNRHITDVVLNSAACNSIRVGDILQATLIRRNNQWYCLELHCIYPRIAGSYVS